VGRFLLVGGTLVLLFVAYQLWGTGIAESHSQSVLHQRFEAELHKAKAKANGHTPPTASAAIPADGAPVGIIRIPKIGVDKVVIEGTSAADLRQGPGHYPGTPLPGENGNSAIAGHRTTYGAPFYNLDALAPGDAIDVTTAQGSFTYRVTRTRVVAPGDVSVVDPTSTPVLTLTTCNPRFSASSRLVVQAALSTTPAPTPVIPKGRPGAPVTAAAGLAGGQGDWTPALWWGLPTALLALAVWLAARRRRRPGARLALYAVGGAGVLVLLFFFFGAVSPLLPASF